MTFKRRLLRLFNRQPFEDCLYFKPEGIYTIGQRKNIMNILTTYADNICVWHDGTLRPMRGHPKVNQTTCTWTYDGQVFIHD